VRHDGWLVAAPLIGISAHLPAQLHARRRSIRVNSGLGTTLVAVFAEEDTDWRVAHAALATSAVS
jgi:hypothetical protein